jgi:hypothetical protein
MTDAVARTASKVPEVTLIFWIIKIAATTLGETGGDTVTMTLNWGYLDGTALFLALLVVLVICQIAAKKFHPFRRLDAAIRVRHRHACRVVLVGRLDIGRHRQHAEGGGVLLDRHYIFPDVGYGTRRLDG